MTATVYCITNLVNGKKYVGVTRFKVNARLSQHIWKSKNNPKTWLHKAIAKYGKDNFRVEEVASCIGDWSETERLVIQSIKPEYNMTNGGEITVGKRVPREVVDLITSKNKGKRRTIEQKKAASEQKLKQYKENPSLKEKCIATLRIAHARRHEFEAKRLEAIKKAAAEGKMARPMTEERKTRQLANITSPEARAKMAASKCKKVLCVTTGITYNSLLEAAEKTQINFASISQVCREKRNSVYGNVFKYI